MRLGSLATPAGRADAAQRRIPPVEVRHLRWLAFLLCVFLAGCGASATRTLDSTVPEALSSTAPMARSELVASITALDLVLSDEFVLAATGQTAYLIEVAGAIGLDRWADLRALTSVTGHYPILLGSTEPFDPFDTGQFEADWKHVVELAGDVALDPDTIDDLDSFDIDEWSAQRRNDPFIGQQNLVVRQDLPKYRGPKGEFIAHVNLFENRPHKRVLLALLPTTTPWEVPFLMNFGAFNDSPLPLEHAAIHRLWFDTYGAEIVSLSLDSLEFSVTRPPEGRDASVDAATIHYLYAPDNVWEGTRNFALLAAGVDGARSWYFWWD